MSYSMVINHFQRVLNSCGDSVILTPTGATSHNGHKMIVEIEKVKIQVRNNCCENVPPPSPECTNNPPSHYWVNRIRFTRNMVDDYSKGVPYSDQEIKGLICSAEDLFGCF
jgi:hypothetical protein